MITISFNQLPSRARRLGAIVLVILLALFHAFTGPAETQSPAAGQGDEIRMPVSNPPLEPNRPDLFREPRVDDP